MAPIQVGLIGLSAKAATSWAANAHLPYLKSTDKYKIVALQNTSKEAAEAAIKHFQLPATTKAYGTPEDIANDPNVQLVVVSTRVDTHYSAARPSIEKGKDVFIEWPLTSSTKESKELVELAKKKGGKIVVGLQGHASPLVRKLKELVNGGKVGKVLSARLIGYGGTTTRAGVKASLAYFFDRKIGGNFVQIAGGHLLHSVHTVHGEFKSFSADGQILRTNLDLRDDSGKVIDTVTSNVPDQLSISGTLESGAHLSVSIRRGPPFKDTPALDWRIYGETGEIRLSGTILSINAFTGDLGIQVEDYSQDSVVDVPYKLLREDLPAPARNIGAVYEAFADGDTTQYADGEYAVKRHEELDAIWQEFDKGSGH